MPLPSVPPFLPCLDGLPEAPLLLAYSGGADSEALLRLLLLRLGEAAPARLRLAHVHHGLSPNANAWEAHCAARAAELGLRFESRRVTLAGTGGAGLEAAARAARYAALAGLMSPGGVLLTAHHRDDQAETLLLRILRGGGTAGAAGLREWQDFGPGRLWRPMLDLPGAELRDWLKAQRIVWLEDESNASPRYARNYLRRDILPALTERWPAAAATLARHAAQAAEDAELLAELAALDLAPARTARREVLALAPLLALRPARQRNALRAWLAELGWARPDQARTSILQEQILRGRADAEASLRLEEGELRRWRGCLHALPRLPDFDALAVQAWRFPEAVELASGLGWLCAQPAGQGLRAPRPDEPVTLRFRAGGERCRPAGRGHSQSLKKLLQEFGIPPWRRERLPLVYFGGELVAVGEVFVCADALAAPGEPAWALRLASVLE